MAVRGEDALYRDVWAGHVAVNPGVFSHTLQPTTTYTPYALRPPPPYTLFTPNRDVWAYHVALYLDFSVYALFPKTYASTLHLIPHASTQHSSSDTLRPAFANVRHTYKAYM